MMFFTFAYKPYIVIIGDIINSRKIEKRGEVQEKLKQILRDINEKYKSFLHTVFINHIYGMYTIQQP